MKIISDDNEAIIDAVPSLEERELNSSSSVNSERTILEPLSFKSGSTSIKTKAKMRISALSANLISSSSSSSSFSPNSNFNSMSLDSSVPLLSNLTKQVEIVVESVLNPCHKDRRKSKRLSSGRKKNPSPSSDQEAPLPQQVAKKASPASSNGEDSISSVFKAKKKQKANKRTASTTVVSVDSRSPANPILSLQSSSKTVTNQLFLPMQTKIP